MNDTICSRRVAPAALAMLAVFAIATAAPPAQAQIHVRAERGGFNYTVADLDGADGVAAGIRFDAAPAYVVDTDAAARVGQREIVNTSDGNITGAPYAIEHDWIPQIHARAAWDGSAATAETTLEPLADGFAKSSSRVELQPWTFSLAPHTRVTFSMDVTIDMHLDPGLSATEFGGVTGAISLYYRQPDGFWSAPIHNDVGGTIGATSWADYGSAYSGTRTALVSWDNTGDTWVDGHVVNTVGTIAQVAWGVPAVPEPGAWAMLGVGLGLLGWRARQKQSA